MNIDKVFIINLKERKDRRDSIINELQRVKIEDYEFFNAIRPTPEAINKWNPLFIKDIPTWFKRLNKDNMKYRLGALGCLLSHLNVIRISKERGYKHVMILEDDSKFSLGNQESFFDKMKSLDGEINRLVNIYGILYLVGNHLPNSFKQVSPNIINTRYTFTTGSYIISEKGMDYVLSNINNYDREIDVFYAEKLQQKIPCFCIYPHIAGQSESYSDIAQINVNYRL